MGLYRWPVSAPKVRPSTRAFPKAFLLDESANAFIPLLSMPGIESS